MLSSLVFASVGAVAVLLVVAERRNRRVRIRMGLRRHRAALDAVHFACTEQALRSAVMAAHPAIVDACVIRPDIRRDPFAFIRVELKFAWWRPEWTRRAAVIAADAAALGALPRTSAQLIVRCAA